VPVSTFTLPYSILPSYIAQQHAYESMYPLQPTVRVERAPARVRVEVEGQARAWAWTQARRQRLLFCGHNSANGSGAYAASLLLLVHAWKATLPTSRLLGENVTQESLRGPSDCGWQRTCAQHTACLLRQLCNCTWQVLINLLICAFVD